MPYRLFNSPVMFWCNKAWGVYIKYTRQSFNLINRHFQPTNKQKFKNKTKKHENMKETKKGLMYLVSVPILESAVGINVFFLSAFEKWLRNLTFAVIVQSHFKVKVRSLRQFWRQNAFCFASRWRLSCAVLATLRASLSGTFLQALPELVSLLKGHCLSPRSCPPTLSAPSERFRH